MLSRSALFFTAAVAALQLPWCDFAHAEIKEHLVKTLPGYPGKLPTRHWSGYLRVPLPDQDRAAYMHYWLIENSKKDPEAPTVVWLQGGPGGSSLIGLLTENGPISLNDFSFQKIGSDGMPRVFDNPFGWHTQANMLYVEHPAPTGFSYCTRLSDEEDVVAARLNNSPGGDADDDDVTCKWTDESQAVASFEFMVTFFSHYPEFGHQPFYLSGESYAGVLVPTLAAEILKHRTHGNRHVAPFSLQGLLLGNAVPGSRILTATPYSGWKGVQVAVDFRYGHGMMSEKTYNKVYELCQGDWNTFTPPANKACREILEDPIRPVLSETGDTDKMGGGYFIYDTCDPDLLIVQDGRMAVAELELNTLKQALMDRARGTTGGGGSDRAAVGRRLGEVNESGKSDGDDGGNDVPQYPNNAGTYACGQERGAMVWLNTERVQEALHVKPTKFSLVTPLTYNHTIDSLVNLYPSLILRYMRVTQYSGDADPCVPYVGTQRWIEGLKLPVSRPWRPWTVDSQVAGYSKAFSFHSADMEEGTTHEMVFVTVRDAGHMVPRYKAKNALHVFKSFLTNQPL